MWHIQIKDFYDFQKHFHSTKVNQHVRSSYVRKQHRSWTVSSLKFLWDSCGIKISETNNTSFDFVGMNNHTFLERLECMSNKLLNSKKRRMFQICVVEKDWLLERNIINRLRHNTIMFCPHLNYNTIVPTLARLLLLLTTS